MITHPPEKNVEAVHLGNFVKVFLKTNAEQLTWALEETGASSKTVEKMKEANLQIDPGLYWENFSFGLIEDRSLKEEEYRAFVELVVKT